MKTKLFLTISILIISISGFSQGWEHIFFNSIGSIRKEKRSYDANLRGDMYLIGTGGRLFLKYKNALSTNIFFVQPETSKYYYVKINKQDVCYFFANSIDNPDILTIFEDSYMDPIHRDLPPSVYSITCFETIGNDSLYVTFSSSKPKYAYSYDRGISWVVRTLDTSSMITGCITTDISITENKDIYISAYGMYNNKESGFIYKISNSDQSVDLVYKFNYDDIPGISENEVLEIEVNSNNDIFAIISNREHLEKLEYGDSIFRPIIPNFGHPSKPKSMVLVNDIICVLEYTGGEGFAYSKDRGNTWDFIANSDSRLDRLQAGPDDCIYGDNFWLENTVFKTINPITEFLNVENDIKAEGLFISPNPATDFIKINLNKKHNFKVNNLKIKIFNTLGQSVLETEKTVFNNTIDINISNLLPGVYVLLLQNDKETYTSKFVKE